MTSRTVQIFIDGAWRTESLASYSPQGSEFAYAGGGRAFQISPQEAALNAHFPTLTLWPGEYPIRDSRGEGSFHAQCPYRGGTLGTVQWR